MREQHQWEIFNLAQKLLSLVEGDRIDQEVKDEVADAVESAQGAPWPDVEEADQHVFA